MRRSFKDIHLRTCVSAVLTGPVLFLMTLSVKTQQNSLLDVYKVHVCFPLSLSMHWLTMSGGTAQQIYSEIIRMT